MSAPQTPHSRIRSVWRWLGVATLLLAALATWLLWPAAPKAVPDSTPAQDATTLERGRYLATLGNCQHCHTARGGQPYAGGRGIATPFGTVYSSNLTPGAAGLGAWGAGDFWRALHHGQSRSGRLLSPVFPYTNTTHITRADSDALYAYLRSLPAVDTPVPAHELRWPYNTQTALKVWRTLYFAEGQPQTEVDAKTDGNELQRGAYLVRGLAHCSACHAPRNALGASRLDPVGGLIPAQNWYAPSLTDPREAGVQDWPLEDIVALLRTGRAGTAVVTGPMSEVVQHSTRHWQDSDLRAMALYLQQLPRSGATSSAIAALPSPAGPGPKLYEKHCANCHGDQGQGVRSKDGGWAYPPLAGNRALALASPANLVQIVLNGGFAPVTAGNPRPFGMPPHVLTLNDTEVAAVVSYVRAQWGQRAEPVTALDVQRLRESAAR